ncbi:major facilitator superfamily MFS_1 [Tolumonas auensis DSM 9187]|uniref:Major facilitator superfamily MFS_1 n=1 Tax=Tolumonas auensis (strain DSM 9187 / NBRC 110442 / TA 4) TaxID=595494 RepID=C4L7H6_TOLAT|nr:MFS transporter [Tolumonas auensis]ACQ93592.1 major facilitator superfamily MFS_1 [Tolumonas auensis DSM 9187]
MTQTLSRKLLFLLALGAGASVANLYYAQPLLAMIANTFNAQTSVGWVASATLVGYTLGIVFILPLGDIVDRRKLTVLLTSVLVISTLVCAFSNSLMLLAFASLFVGFGAIITQILVPLAADLSMPEQRSHSVGVVFSGILAGILLARTISGAIGQSLGWRPMFVFASIVALILGIVLRASLPKVKPKTTQPYSELLKSMFSLLIKHRQLRIACAIQACLFAIFNAFWSTLALLLAKPPFEQGAAIAGAFGILGLVGVLAANMSGRMTTRYGVQKILLSGLIFCAIAYGIFMISPTMAGLIVGVVLLDFGLSIANVSNQSMILGLDAQASSRINTIYVSTIFIGGSIGAAAASILWVQSGWLAVCGFGFVVALLALAIHHFGRVKEDN